MGNMGDFSLSKVSQEKIDRWNQISSYQQSPGKGREGFRYGNDMFLTKINFLTK